MRLHSASRPRGRERHWWSDEIRASAAPDSVSPSARDYSLPPALPEQRLKICNMSRYSSRLSLRRDRRSQGKKASVAPIGLCLSRPVIRAGVLSLAPIQSALISLLTSESDVLHKKRRTPSRVRCKLYPLAPNLSGRSLRHIGRKTNRH